MKETELFEPIKKHLEDFGYDVYSEVKGVDVVGINRKNGDVALVEMKTSLNTKLLLQALRNRAYYPTAKIYIAFPKKDGVKGLSDSDREKIEILNLSGKNIGILVYDTSDNSVNVNERGNNSIKHAFKIFNQACTDLHKEKTAGAKTGETKTERMLIIDRIIKVLELLPDNECDLDNLTDVFVPSILQHYSSKESFKSVMRNTASTVFNITKNTIYLRSEE